jgi:hypothetical protein
LNTERTEEDQWGLTPLIRRRTEEGKKGRPLCATVRPCG